MIVEQPSKRAETDQSAGDVELAQALEKYLADLEAGRDPNPERLVADHPAIAERLRACLASLHLVEQAAGSLDAGTLVDSPDPDGRRLGDFRILGELGRGGMGVVYEAEQISLKRLVALKVLPFAAMLDRRQLQRFKNEAQAAATLDHPGIVPVHAVGCERGVHYYAMRLIEGHTLAQVIEGLRPHASDHHRGKADPTDADGQTTGGSASASRAAKHHVPVGGELTAPHDGQDDRVPRASVDTLRIRQAAISTEHSSHSPRFFRTVANLGIQAAEALDHAHQHGVLHRDIKPGNLMLDAEGKLWITDFGLARIETGASMTMTGDLLGTLRYMAPEQALTDRVAVDHRADIYSLGVTLYELITLQPAFRGDDRKALLRQIAFDEPPNPRRLREDIPPDLETIVLKAMSKDPPERYATAQDLAEDIRRFVEDRPITAKRPSLAARTMKWSRRNPAFLVTASLLLLGATAFLGMSTLLLNRAKIKTLAALDEAKDSEQRARSETAKTKAALIMVRRMLGLGMPFETETASELGRLRRLDWLTMEFGKGLGGQPEVEARLRQHAGQLYLRLGMHDDALAQFRTAVDLLQSTVGRDDAKYVHLLEYYAGTLSRVGQTTEAVTIAREAVAVSRSMEADTIPLIRSLIMLGRIAWSQKKLEESESVFREALDGARRDLSGEDPILGEVLRDVGKVLAAQGKYEEAEATLREAVSIVRKTESPEEIANTLLRLGDVLANPWNPSHNAPVAETLLREVMTILRDEGVAEDSNLVRLADESLLAALSAQGKHDAEYGRLERVVHLRRLAKSGTDASVSYKVRIQTPGEYRLYLRWDGHDSASDSIFARITELADGPGGSDADVYQYSRSDENAEDADFGTSSWDGTGESARHGYSPDSESRVPVVWSIDVAGDYTIQLVNREDGASVDALVLQLASLAAPRGVGPDESPTTEDGIFIEAKGLLAMEAEHFSHRSEGKAMWRVVPTENAGDVTHVQFRGPAFIQFLPDTSPARPGDPWVHRGLVGLEEGKWDETRDTMKKAISLPPDRAISLAPDRIVLRYHHALRCLQRDRMGAYRDFCAETLERFGTSDDKEVAFWTAWTCTLAPDAVSDLEQLVESAETARRSDPQNASYIMASGAALYRAGRDEASVALLRDMVANWEKGQEMPTQTSPAYAWYYLAMACNQLGRPAEARQWLERAEAWTERKLSSEHTGPDSALPWNRRATLELLSDEATRVLRGADKEPEKEKPSVRDAA